ncbi:tRNA-specific adenosine-34 deaminase subunit Tad3 [Aspergillus piperis CBS 112811]|uniref:tRNA-specific adenosine-34 deaminase subunit Tad3 n=1 Tax=Aspergillus piperis CBS 112811 TaxID=1448313 RepID=A0A8G1R251_9EURO|nr:tRNA-specific adenosine-34 deaminase subunit Tad3 [Aspergillus piperis CBS 112811]RAH55495.1 tRNA-specific adenosine-34 deaminase subunit Tad3 [Aspergillus piperis CBS 112811]
MDVEELLRGIKPLEGQVTAIRTVQETRPREDYADAYVTEVNVKCASKVIKVLDSRFPRDSSQPLSHLRRFAKHNQIPEHLRPILLREGSSPAQTIFVLISPPLPDIESLQDALSPFAPPTPTEGENSSPLTFHTIRIPLQPPLTPVQADAWSKSMWPVVYNPAAPRAMIAPPPHILARARDSIQPKAGRYLALAQRVADEAERSGLGRRVGAVVVDPDLEAEAAPDNNDNGIHWSDAVVAVAGDGRYSRAATDTEAPNPPNHIATTYSPDHEGGPELHALMRAVDLIASKRREDRPGSSATNRPCLTDVERYFLSKSDVDTTAAATSTSTSRIRPRSQGGYLCTDLDVYLTHEPCICCSMGLLLSRFRAVLFPRSGRMVSGGLASEPVVGPVPVEEDEDKNEDGKDEHDDGSVEREYYGLHWRKELNWRALGFEFVEEQGSAEGSAELGVAFHA